MDQAFSRKICSKCLKHNSKSVKFIKINELKNDNISENSNLFYCTNCADEDYDFKTCNYILVEKIIKQGQTEIIPKWPPVKDYTLIDKLIKQTQEFDSSHSLVQQITNYFSDFKKEFLQKIDLLQKKMLNRALELPLGKDQILNKYQEVSKIIEFRKLVLNSQQDQIKNSKDCQKFITQLEQQKETNTLLLQQLLDSNKQISEKVSFEYPNALKQSIYTILDDISFFKENNNYKNNLAQKKKIQVNAEQIMKLIANKSNRCSDEFLNQMREKLTKFNNIFSSISIEKIHENNQQPINFSLLRNDQLELVEQYTQHVDQMNNNSEYMKNISQDPIIKQIKEILDSPLNFVKSSFSDQFIQFLSLNYPFLESFKKEESIMDRTKFDHFQNMNDDFVNTLLKLQKQKGQFEINDSYNNSQTIKMKNALLGQLIQQFQLKDLNWIFLQFPLFDLIQSKQQIDILDQIKLVKTNHQEGQKMLNIYKNSQNEEVVYFKLLQGYNLSDKNCVSDKNLEKDKKYVFRIQINNFSEEIKSFILGLMDEKEIHTKSGYDNKMSIQMTNNNSNNKIIKRYNQKRGIDKQIIGNIFELSEENTIEMRVWLEGQQLEVLDYPNYLYKVGLSDEHKQNLNSNSLRFYLNLNRENFNFILKNAYIVDLFDE